MDYCQPSWKNQKVSTIILSDHWICDLMCRMIAVVIYSRAMLVRCENSRPADEKCHCCIGFFWKNVRRDWLHTLLCVFICIDS